MSEIIEPGFTLDEDEERFGPDFWAQHPDSPDRVALREWIDGPLMRAGEMAVHAVMEESYQRSRAQAAHANQGGGFPVPIIDNVAFAPVAPEKVASVIPIEAAPSRRRRQRFTGSSRDTLETNVN
ncbi:MAG TPA: hypothetical protein VFT16_03140 [Candidatus Saccharimonadales bacterium]|nr:hypothetical protein [Candidatus Saccharimonadales bacterium]